MSEMTKVKVLPLVDAVSASLGGVLQNVLEQCKRGCAGGCAVPVLWVLCE